MLARMLTALSPEQKHRLRGWYRAGELAFVRRFRSYTPDELKNFLRRLGLQTGETVLVHSAYSARLGFQGSPNELINTLIDVVGTTGNLLMTSMPYLSSTSDYLKKNTV